MPARPRQPFDVPIPAHREASQADSSAPPFWGDRGELITRGTVDALTEQVSMAVVPGVFGDHVHQDAAQ